MNYHQLESEYISEENNKDISSEGFTRATPNTTIWNFQAFSIAQLVEIVTSF